MKRWMGLGLIAMLAWGCDDGESGEGPGGAADGSVVADMDRLDQGALPDALVDGGAEDRGVGDGAADAQVDGAADMAAPRCGDGTLDDGEACDDGNVDAGDGCDPLCAWEPQATVEPDGRDQPLALRFDGNGRAEATFALESRMDADWFRFTLDAASDVSIEVMHVDGVSPCPGDPSLSLYTEDAAPVLTVADGLRTICPVAAPGTHPLLTGLAAGTWTIRVSPAIEPIPDLRIVVRKLPRLGDGEGCREDGVSGLCDEPTRCGRTDLLTLEGQCLPAGCGDWLRDEGEACDAPEAYCSDDCNLAGATEVEPNDTPAQANAMGPSTVPQLGNWQIATTLSGVEDRDHFKLTLPPGVVDLQLHVFDGFLFCPGGVRAVVTDEDGAVLGRTDQACETLELEALPGGRVVQIRLATDDVGVPNRPMLLFVLTVPRVGQGEACAAIGFPRCRAGAWCVDNRCIADVCGDGRLGPDEGCDDGNLAPGDGCDEACAVEVQAIDPPGGDFPLRAPPEAALRFSLALREPGAQVTFETLGRDGVCPADTRLRLFAGDALLAEVDDLEDGGLCAVLTHVLPGGDYTLLLDHRDRGLLDDLILRVSYGPVSAVGEPCGPEAPPCAAEAFCGGDTCRVHACGDGILGPDEECDDGNLVSEDGCSAECIFEASPLGDGGDFQRPDLSFEDADVFDFELVEARRFRAWTDNGAGRCNGDAAMDLERFEDGAWQLVASDDDGGVTICPRIDRPLGPGRYQLAVYGVDDDLLAYTLHARLQPQREPGAACDPLAEADACTSGHACRATAAGATCVSLGALRDQQEPDDFTEDVRPVAPDTIVRARLEDMFGADSIDLFAIELVAPARLRVETGDGDGGCPGDTLLHRLDPGLWDAEDADTAILAAFVTSDDTDNLRCSVLEEDLPAGIHWYAVEEYERDEALSYALMARILPVRGAGEACDAVLRNPWDVPWFDRCGQGLRCVAQPGQALGTCQAP
ncbi:MAG: DUF4215 domain-containing protein [Myxococcales bacterium]|nr:DUF4215 domain-containing protein [Myxococcales bacterium]